MQGPVCCLDKSVFFCLPSSQGLSQLVTQPCTLLWGHSGLQGSRIFTVADKNLSPQTYLAGLCNPYPALVDCVSSLRTSASVYSSYVQVFRKRQLSKCAFLGGEGHSHGGSVPDLTRMPSQQLTHSVHIF